MLEINVHLITQTLSAQNITMKFCFHTFWASQEHRQPLLRVAGIQTWEFFWMMTHVSTSFFHDGLQDDLLRILQAALIWPWQDRQASAASCSMQFKDFLLHGVGVASRTDGFTRSDGFIGMVGWLCLANVQEACVLPLESKPVCIWIPAGAFSNLQATQIWLVGYWEAAARPNPGKLILCKSIWT